LVGKSAGKRGIGRSRHRWEYNIKFDPKEIEREVASLFLLAQDRDK
jgi:hypothetical protein